MAKYQKWTDDRISQFIELYPDTPWDDLERIFHSKKGSLLTMASNLGISRKGQNTPYTAEEDRTIIEMFGSGCTDTEIAACLSGRSPTAIKCRRIKLGCFERTMWTAEESELFEQLYPALPLTDVLQFFPGRSRDALIAHGTKFGIKAWMPYTTYSDNDLQFIREHYLTMSDAEMGEILNHSRASIKNRRNALGCHRIDGGASNYDDVSLYVRRHNQDWKVASMRQCDFKCIVSGERFSAIHHLQSQNTILQDTLTSLGLNKYTFNINQLTPDEKQEFLNAFYAEQAKYPLGVCLRQDIHQRFHTMYGFGDNTPEQFLEFLSVEYPNRQIEIVA